MPAEFADITAWLDHCRHLVRTDWDNVILTTGDERKGKSTLAYQVLKALDPSFGPHRVAFTVRQFLQLAPTVPRGCAVMLDEAKLHRREAMSKDTRRFLDYLKDCGALNHHVAICYPHDEMFEGAILDFRVRWNLEVKRRGLFELRRRVQSKRQSRVEFKWRTVGRWTFDANRGPEWDTYQRAKTTHMQSHGILSEETDGDAKSSPRRIDADAFTARAAALIEQYDERARQRAAARM